MNTSLAIILNLINKMPHFHIIIYFSMDTTEICLIFSYVVMYDPQSLSCGYQGPSYLLLIWTPLVS